KAPEAPRELPPGAWEPPPVRRKEGAEPDAQSAADDNVPTPDVSPPTVPAPATTVLGKYIIAACMVLMAGGGFFLWYQLVTGSKPEEEARTQAAGAFEERDYSKAASHYAGLARSFPESDRRKEYDFYRDLSQLLSDASGVRVELDTALDRLRRFLKDYHDD